MPEKRMLVYITGCVISNYSGALKVEATYPNSSLGYFACRLWLALKRSCLNRIERDRMSVARKPL